MQQTIPNPWSDMAPAPKVRTSTNLIWPDRLLHVPTMKSYRNDGKNVYGNTPEPRYNVLSYTWGYFRDMSIGAKDQHVTIHGIGWRIPSIQHNHFTPDQFKRAIERAAHGVQKEPCGWLWVDIACIPQQQEGEGPDSEQLRKQEIGRQVGIFARAQEAFVWLSTLETSQIRKQGERHVRAEALLNYTLAFNGSKMDTPEMRDLAVNILEGLNRESGIYVKWLGSIIQEPWFKSLWTLQEMVLRPDALILFRDGLLEIDEDQNRLFTCPFPASSLRDLRRSNAITSNTSGMWSLSDLKFEIQILDQMVNCDHFTRLLTWDVVSGIETELRRRGGLPCDLSSVDNLVTRIRRDLETTLKLMRERGMDVLDISLAHTAYSAASHRRVANSLDNIYGIVQAYGISCDPNPPGTSDEERLKALEDDFGSQLVSQYPVISQLFIHTEEPRRSWLITKGCQVDSWWELFEANMKVINLTETFRINNEHAEGPCVEFKGFAWELEPFIEAGSSHVLKPMGTRGPVFYNGLLLDYHISNTFLKKEIDYLSSCDGMAKAAQQLNHHYSAKGLERLRVASLGCSFEDHSGMVNHVGLVLAPSWPDKCVLGGDAKPEFWVRIGLMRWVENYGGFGPRHEHPHLPTPHEFQCIIK